ALAFYVVIGGGSHVAPVPSSTAAATTPPVASPTPMPSPGPLTQTFTSDLYGFSIKYPSNWTAVSSANARWDSSGAPVAGPAIADYVGNDQSFGVSVGIVAARLDPGETASQWYDHWVMIARANAASGDTLDWAKCLVDRAQWQSFTVAGSITASGY